MKVHKSEEAHDEAPIYEVGKWYGRGGVGAEVVPGSEPKPNGKVVEVDEEDEDEDDEGEPTEDWKKWRQYARDRGKRAIKLRSERNEARTLAQQRADEVAAIRAKAAADLEAERTAAKNGTEAAVKDAVSKADQRLIRAEIKRALVAEKCKDTDAALTLVDGSAIKITDAGDVEGVTEALAKLKESKAYLFGDAPKSTTKTDPMPKGKTEGDPVDVRTMTDAEYAAHLALQGIKLPRR